MYSHLMPDVQEETRLLAVLAVNPASSPEHSEALAGSDPVQEKPVQEVEFRFHVPLLQV